MELVDLSFGNINSFQINLFRVHQQLSSSPTSLFYVHITRVEDVQCKITALHNCCHNYWYCALSSKPATLIRLLVYFVGDFPIPETFGRIGYKKNIYINLFTTVNVFSLMQNYFNVKLNLLCLLVG